MYSIHIPTTLQMLGKFAILFISLKCFATRLELRSKNLVVCFLALSLESAKSGHIDHRSTDGSKRGHPRLPLSPSVYSPGLICYRKTLTDLRVRYGANVSLVCYRQENGAQSVCLKYLFIVNIFKTFWITILRVTLINFIIANGVGRPIDIILTSASTMIIKII